MGFWGALAGGAAAPVIDALGTAVDKVFTSDAERLAAQAVLEKLRAEPAALQVELNKIEAAHPSIFVSGWRPGLGWTCVAAMSWNYVMHPLLTWVLAVWYPAVASPPLMDSSEISGVLMALLGLAGMRTYEKKSGVAR